MRTGGRGEGGAVRRGESLTTLSVPPGRLEISCGHDDNSSSIDEPVTVTVIDTGRHYRRIDVTAALGCTPNATAYAPPVGQFPTASEALNALTAQIGGTVETTPRPGYQAAAQQGLLLHRDGRGYGTATVYPGDGGFYAALGSLCTR